MAWLQNLAGKAEDLLNKIDQNAATVLMENDNETITVESSNLADDPRYGSEEKSVFEKIQHSQSSPNFRYEQETNPEPSKEQEQSHSFNEDSDEKSLGTLSGSSKSSSIQIGVIESPPVNYLEKINRLEKENCDLNKQILNLQHLYSQIQNDNGNLRSQVEAANHLACTAQSEMQQYKVRSQRILKEKEKLIALKKANSDDEGSNKIIYNYNEDLKKELEFEQNRNDELMRKNDILKNQIVLHQQQLLMAQNSMLESSESLKATLATEIELKLIAEDERKAKSEALQMKIQELIHANNVIKQQNIEITNLKNGLMKASAVFKSDEDLESRIKLLTNTLMSKQNNLENVTSERNALRLQLEKLLKEHQENLLKLQRCQVNVINVNDTDDAKSEVPQFLRVSPLDAGVTRRVKHAYSTVDSVSIRTGVFLRRYPVARVFVFSYMVLLQIWALIVLFLYAPSNR